MKSALSPSVSHKHFHFLIAPFHCLHFFSVPDSRITTTLAPSTTPLRLHTETQCTAQTAHPQYCLQTHRLLHCKRRRVAQWTTAGLTNMWSSSWSRNTTQMLSNLQFGVLTAVYVPQTGIIPRRKLKFYWPKIEGWWLPNSRVSQPTFYCQKNKSEDHLPK